MSEQSMPEPKEKPSGSTSKTTKFKIPRSVSILLKVFIIGFLTLLLLIPLSMIDSVIRERQELKQDVVNEISQTWGGAQVITGPILAIPYREIIETKNDKGQKQINVYKKLSYVLPADYRLESDIKPEVRYRGIYQSIVYNSTVTVTGTFDFSAIRELNIPEENILWKEAFLVTGIPQTKGITKAPDFDWMGKKVEMLPGVNGANFLQSGLYAPANLGIVNQPLPFRLKLSLNGSQSFSMVPIGKQNTFTIASTWKSPSFTGNALPTQREVGEKGFSATWNIPYYARNFGQALRHSDNLSSEIFLSQVGVDLLSPVDAYRQSERATKYGILFLLLTFATYFLFEMLCHYKLHPFQYLLIGCAISLFYLLLIALSEILMFDWAYCIASITTIGVISLYSKAILGKARKKAPFLIAGLLSALYGYLYVLLSLEDLSLLFGTIGLFIVLAVIMYVTRNIDWYSEQSA